MERIGIEFFWQHSFVLFLLYFINNFLYLAKEGLSNGKKIFLFSLTTYFWFSSINSQLVRCWELWRKPHTSIKEESFKVRVVWTLWIFDVSLNLLASKFFSIYRLPAWHAKGLQRKTMCIACYRQANPINLSSDHFYLCHKALFSFFQSCR